MGRVGGFRSGATRHMQLAGCWKALWDSTARANWAAARIHGAGRGFIGKEYTGAALLLGRRGCSRGLGWCGWSGMGEGSREAAGRAPSAVAPHKSALPRQLTLQPPAPPLVLVDAEDADAVHAAHLAHREHDNHQQVQAEGLAPEVGSVGGQQEEQHGHNSEELARRGALHAVVNLLPEGEAVGRGRERGRRVVGNQPAASGLRCCRPTSTTAACRHTATDCKVSKQHAHAAPAQAQQLEN